MGSLSVITSLIGSIIDPVAKVINKRQDRKIADDTCKGKLRQAKQDGELKVELNDQEWERVNVSMQNSSWKDEYATVSVMSIFNLFVIGGVASAFGEPELMEGIVVAVTALTTVGVDVGLLIQVTVFAALGLHIVRKM